MVNALIKKHGMPDHFHIELSREVGKSHIMCWMSVNLNITQINHSVPKENFGLFLKECEWHFNNSDPLFKLIKLKQVIKQQMN